MKLLLNTTSVAPGGVMLFMLAGRGAVTVLPNHKRSAAWGVVGGLAAPADPAGSVSLEIESVTLGMAYAY